MKLRLKKAAAVVILLMLSSPLRAQNYFRGEQTVIQPLQVIIENYTVISLAKEITDEGNLNRFDKYNAYTYIQIIRNNLGNDCHILFQTSFSGKVLFLAYSNNLGGIFNNKDKPLNVFVNCIKHVNDHLSALQNVEAAVKCIVERLNYCSN